MPIDLARYPSNQSLKLAIVNRSAAQKLAKESSEKKHKITPGMRAKRKNVTRLAGFIIIKLVVYHTLLIQFIT
tara:strand:- start:1055 stop:1273 length:219 start_codon:yes stop_codon:yes gene_type:complete